MTAPTKAALIDLVKELRAEGMTTSQIGEALRYSPQRVGQVLVDLGLHKPAKFANVFDAVKALSPGVRRRLAAFRRLQNLHLKTKSKT